MRFFHLEPITAYHGTGSQFESFELEKTGFIGVYFTTDRNTAQMFAQNQASYLKTTPIIITAKLHIKKPMELDMYKQLLNDASGGNPRKQVRDKAIEMGYDSVISNEIIVFDLDIIEILKAEQV